MAVSPNVDAYMAQTAQQAPSQTAEDTFVREFGNQAFNALRAKYPSIADRVITFKTLASEMDTSTAFGVFIVESGADVAYIRASWRADPSPPAKWPMTRRRTSSSR